MGDAVNVELLGSLTKYGNDFAALPLATDVFNAYPVTDFKYAQFAADFRYIALFGGGYNPFSTQVINQVQLLLGKGRKVLINCEGGQAYAYSSNGSSTAKTFYTEYLGLQAATLFQRVTTNEQGQITSIIPFQVQGKSADKIAAGMNFTLNQYDQNSHPYFTVYTDVLNPPAGSKSTAFMYYDNDQTRGAAIRFEDGRARLVYMSFGIEQINVPSMRGQLYAKILDWLFEKGMNNGPEISVNTGDLNFGTVSAGNQKDLTINITNVGDENLTIENVFVDWDELFPGIYSVVDPPSFPFVIEPAGVYEITVRFAPAEKMNYNGPVLKIASDAVNSREEDRKSVV